MVFHGPGRNNSWAAWGGHFVLLVSSPAFAAGPTPWVASLHSAARLVDAGPAGAAVAGGSVPGTRLAGVEIKLDPRFITYWRSPGEAGIAPSFSFGQSGNLASAAVSYPAPRLLEEGGSTAFGYAGEVTFPVIVAPRDLARPVDLDVLVDYGVCGTLCLPAKAHLRLRLEGDAGQAAAVVRDALGEVPRPVPLGAEGPVRIEAVRGRLSGATAGLSVQAAAPSGSGTLFAEAPEGWFVEAGPGIPLGGDRVSFDLKVLERPSDGSLPGGPLRLTLVSPTEAIDVSVPLDSIEPRP